MIRFFVAMQREADALGLPCELIGIGAADLPDTSPEDILVNVGYAGAYRLPPGTVVAPDFVTGWSSKDAICLNQPFSCEQHPCITADSFVTEPLYTFPAVYDMELWKIAKLPHKKLYSLKIVSDNLDEKDCEAFDSREAWDEVRRLLEGAKLI